MTWSGTGPPPKGFLADGNRKLLQLAGRLTLGGLEPFDVGDEMSRERQGLVQGFEKVPCDGKGRAGDSQRCLGRI